MGYLHAGHQSLISRARRENDLVIVSVFVNPLQFGPQEDYSRYPRDLEHDCRLAASAGADIVFAPPVEEMYPHPIRTHVDVENLGDFLCGRSRPGHFRGVCTVVCKLFNIAQPDKAYFGQKDAQQLAIIRQMVADLNIPVAVVPVPIARDSDGLALSSRNVYLTPEERSQAPVLYRSLQQAKEMFAAGERDCSRIKAELTRSISAVPGTTIDYIEITDLHTLQPVAHINASVLVALAVWFSNTRLIDNIILAEE